MFHATAPSVVEPFDTVRYSRFEFSAFFKELLAELQAIRVSGIHLKKVRYHVPRLSVIPERAEHAHPRKHQRCILRLSFQSVIDEDGCGVGMPGPELDVDERGQSIAVVVVLSEDLLQFLPGLLVSSFPRQRLPEQHLGIAVLVRREVLLKLTDGFGLWRTAQAYDSARLADRKFRLVTLVRRGSKSSRSVMWRPRRTPGTRIGRRGSSREKCTCCSVFLYFFRDGTVQRGTK